MTSGGKTLCKTVKLTGKANAGALAKIIQLLKQVKAPDREV